MTHQTLTQRLHALFRHAEILHAWRLRRELPLDGWTIQRTGESAQSIALGAAWTPTEDDLPVKFSLETRVPADLGEAELELDFGGEGEAWVWHEGREVAHLGLNAYHQAVRLGTLTAGEALHVRVEAVARGFFGEPQQPRLARAVLTEREPGVDRFTLELHALLEAARELETHEVVPQLLSIAEEAVALLAWPSDTQEVLGRGHPGIGRGATGVWRLPNFPKPRPLSFQARASAEQALDYLHCELERLRRRYPPVGRLALSGHAHIDLAWLWPVAETRRKIRRTFGTQLALLERYPEMTFNQSSAQIYAWLQTDAPDLFDQVAARVREGRIEAVGGTWVEPDGQMPSGEAWARHFLYGQRYFEQHFGRRSTVLWLPDTFGYAPALPQIMRLAGITGFFTTKMSWNETNTFPHDLFAWEGLDGTRITTHMFHNWGSGAVAAGGYNGEIRPRDLLSTWRNFRGKQLRVWGDGEPTSLFSHGYGDGGGGPSRENLERFQFLRDFPALPRLSMTRVDDFFRGLPTQGLPVWVGELYLELHRATLTTQSRVKKLNREAEHRLVEAELVTCLTSLVGRPSLRQRLEQAWKTLLLNQFHDILPGSSIAEVYAAALPELEGVVREAETICQEAATPQAGMFSILNPSLEPRCAPVLIPGAVAGQKVEGGGLIPVELPPLGVHQVEANDHGLGHHTAGLSPVTAMQMGEAFVLRAQDGSLEAQIGPDGTLHRLICSELPCGSEGVLDGRGNVLMAYVDLPREWEAWDTATAVGDPGEEVGGVQRIEILETGPWRAAVRVTRVWRSSRIVQTYRLEVGSGRLDVETQMDWHERRTMLRALFPLRVHTRQATFETAFGSVVRPTHRNTSWDAARFEVCGHRWADLSQADWGVALLNDGKYGHSTLESTLGLSLVRGPMWPDALADEGEQRFTYALYPHTGNARTGRVAQAALALNSPLMLLPGRLAPPTLRVQGEGVMLSALKHAEDGVGLVLRLYEPYGAHAEFTLACAQLQDAWRVNLLEDPIGEVPLETSGQGSQLRLTLRPFEIASLRLRFGSPTTGQTGPG
ncbi:glycoside hydrolase family 38 C-terminal domain-containing protein [Deinococcus hopiensis]|uniref:Alpha-mannosidase n=1 Tax=Deinococcus hopiensis KR-140 TaxID=695939 RepID=A0A1W1UJD1_9DEIO|nr:glycoside hydrolase family 38 C-terminal domain-containing protein [Deinococcus hopiensis]SMB81123.1 alpha-mannosidase [Deinococcus hopiensis KR-140]